MFETIRHKFSPEGRLENAARKITPCEKASDLFKDLLDEAKIINLVSKHFRQELKIILGEEGKPKGWDWEDVAVELFTNPGIQEKCENLESFKNKIELIAKVQNRDVKDLNKLIEELKEMAQERWERIKKLINANDFDENSFIGETAWEIDARHPLASIQEDLDKKIKRVIDAILDFFVFAQQSKTDAMNLHERLEHKIYKIQNP